MNIEVARFVCRVGGRGRRGIGVSRVSSRTSRRTRWCRKWRRREQPPRWRHCHGVLGRRTRRYCPLSISGMTPSRAETGSQAKAKARYRGKKRADLYALSGEKEVQGLLHTTGESEKAPHTLCVNLSKVSLRRLVYCVKRMSLSVILSRYPL